VATPTIAQSPTTGTILNQVPDRVFVRQISCRDGEWRDGVEVNGDKEPLSSSTFSRIDDDRVSVYEVASDLEEAAVATTLQVVMRGIYTKPAYLLRIRSSLLQELGVSIDAQEKGTTGVDAIDDLHRDLIGKSDAFARLTAILLKRILGGADCVREVRKAQFPHQISLLCDGTLNDYARKRMEKAISQK